jgi:hypothetical protein
MLLNQTSGFHYELFFKKDMLIKLYVGNYATLYGLVNGVDDNFQILYKNWLKNNDMDKVLQSTNWN